MEVSFAVQRPVPSHSGEMTAHLGLVLHVQVGDNSPYGEFDNPNNSASSTWWVGKDGTLEQYVDSDLAAWTQAAGNFTWNGVETEGYPTEPLTTAQIQTLARLYVWGHEAYGWPLSLSEDPNTPGFGWHGMGGEAWGGHFGCPGDIRKAQRAAVLYLAALVLNPPAPIPSPFKENEMHAVVMPNGDIKIYAAGAGDRAGHLMEFTRHDADQSNSVIDITAQIGGSDLFTVQP